MQKLQSLDDNFKVNGYTFFVHRITNSIFEIYYLSDLNDYSIRPKFVTNFYCKSNNIYYIRRRARILIHEILRTLNPDELTN